MKQGGTEILWHLIIWEVNLPECTELNNLISCFPGKQGIFITTKREMNLAVPFNIKGKQLHEYVMHFNIKGACKVN